jgi:3-hydroxyacyl-CoA dehydrogenase/enoyl-CoA hydratase/3-hydroxybutyryl-CoA epimerase
MANLTYDIDAEGIALITWDMPNRSMNVLDSASIDEFAEIVDRVLCDDAVKACVITSAKSAFIAGADLAWMEQLAAEAKEGTYEERAARIVRRAGRLSALFRRYERGGKPFVAAINGTALGGGMELCLACHHLIVADDPRIRLGLPEANVGLLPGAGGTQRLSRILGPLKALPYLLEGKHIPPQQALELGIVHGIVPPAQLVEAARSWARSATAEDTIKPWDRKGYRVPGDDPRTLEGSLAFAAANAGVRAGTWGNYPAQEAIQRAVFDGLLVPIDTALKIELRYFAQLVVDPVSRNLIRTRFLNVQKAGKLARRPKVETGSITKVGVIGAGMMGRGIALVAAQAGLDVVLVDRTAETAEKGRAEAVRTATRRSAAAAAEIAGRISAGDDFAALSGAQLVIEAVFEDPELKADVLARAEAAAPRAVIASNTSSLRIAGLANSVANPANFLGVHFFSPVERMQLVEIIRGSQTGDHALARAMDFTALLRKTSIVVNDGPFFYTSRVFATYTNEGIRMLAEGVNPALIENAGRAIGMPVPPLALNDEIALDLVYRINRAQPDRSEDSAAKVIARMVEEFDRPGRKMGKGFYEYRDDGTRRLWTGLDQIAERSAEQPSFEEVKARLLLIQCVEAARCMEEGIVTDAADADVGSLLGWGFSPWTGGPLSHIDTMGAANFVEQCETLAARYGDRFAPSASVKQMADEGREFYMTTVAAAA